MEESITLENKLQKYFVNVVLKESPDQQQNIEEVEMQEGKQPNDLSESNKKQFLLNFFSKVQVHTLLEMVGDEGRYQYILMVILCLYNFVYAFIGFFIGYLYYEPKFLCFDANQQSYECSEQAACSNPYGFNIDSPIRSLVTEFNLYCDRSSLKEKTQGFFIVIAGVLAFIFGVLSD